MSFLSLLIWSYDFYHFVNICFICGCWTIVESLEKFHLTMVYDSFIVLLKLVCQNPLANWKMREFQKDIYFCFIDYAKAFDCVDHNKLWKILKEMWIPDHLTCLLRNLYAGQEATSRSGHGTTDWFQIGKGVRQGCILPPCLFNFNAVYIMRNAGLEE